MMQERQSLGDPRIQGAIVELQELIRQHYPTTTFEVSSAADEPEAVHLTAIVDVADTDPVLDLVIDRVVQLQVDERIPVHVIPVRTPERILAEMQVPTGLKPPRRSRALPLFAKSRTDDDS